MMELIECTVCGELPEWTDVGLVLQGTSKDCDLCYHALGECPADHWVSLMTTLKVRDAATWNVGYSEGVSDATLWDTIAAAPRDGTLITATWSLTIDPPLSSKGVIVAWRRGHWLDIFTGFQYDDEAFELFSVFPESPHGEP